MNTCNGVCPSTSFSFCSGSLSPAFIISLRTCGAKVAQSHGENGKGDNTFVTALPQRSDLRLQPGVAAYSSCIVHDNDTEAEREREGGAGKAVEDSNGGCDSNDKRSVTRWHSTRVEENLVRR